MGIQISVRFPGQAETIEFKAPQAGVSFNVTPQDAINYFAGKGLKPTFAWQDMLADEHDKAFTVAKMMRVDLMADVRNAVDDAISTGKSLNWFRNELEPTLIANGWWGKQDVVDPLTGKVVTAQLGSARRLELIFRTNMQTSYSVGHWNQIQANKELQPWIMYDAVDDSRTRPEHQALDGKVLPADSEFWNSHFPPNGWNCRCGVVQMTDSELTEYGLTPSKPPKIRYRTWKNPRTGISRKVPRDLDPGWDHNPGIGYHEKAQALLSEKIAQLPEDMAKAALAARKAEAKAKAAYQSQTAAKAAHNALAKEQGVLAQARAIESAKQRAAASQIQAISETKVQYLSAALNQVQGTKAYATMKPTEVLALIKDKAVKAKASASIAHYKQSSIKGKKPSAAAQAAFDDLPGEAQKAITAEIESKSVIIQQKKAAQAALVDIAANPKGQKLKTSALNEKLAGKALADVDDPVALLKAVEDQAAAVQAKASQSAALSGYKGKILEDKIPTPAQKKAFDALTPSEQNDFLLKVGTAKIEVDAFKVGYVKAYATKPTANEIKGFIKANKKTKKETLDFLKTKEPKPSVAPVGVEPASAKALPAKAPDYDDLTVEEKYRAMYKVSGADAWLPPDSKAFKNLSLQDKDDLLAELEGIFEEMLDDDPIQAAQYYINKQAAAGYAWKIKAKPKPKPKPKLAPIAPVGDVEDWSKKPLTKTGAQKGSNTGGFYQDTESGEKWYVKTPSGEDVARNEVLAAKLYEAAGIEVPDLHLVSVEKGRVSIASRIVDGITENKAAVTRGTLTGQNDGFAVDAWLANWDVTGLGFDNLVVKGSRAIRVDVGGSLRYRAQGGMKGAAFGDVVDEIDSLRDAATNPQSAAAFAKVKKADIEAGVSRIAAVSDDDITRMVNDWGPRDATERAALTKTIIARKNDLLKRYPSATKAKPVPAPKTGIGVSKAEQKAISEARQNGVSIPTDGGDIEDQAVLLWREADAAGNLRTHAQLKLIGDAAAKMDARLGSLIKKGAAPSVTSQADDSVVTAIKGILTNPELRAKDIERATMAIDAIRSASSAVSAAVQAGDLAVAANAAFIKHYKPWSDWFKKIKSRGAGGKHADIAPPPGTFSPASLPKAKAKAPSVKEIAFEAKTGGFTQKTIIKGRAVDKGQRNWQGTDYFEAEIDGSTVRYWPNSDNTPFALRGRVEIIAKGQAISASNAPFSVLEKLGINGKRATKLDREELYLIQIGNHRNSPAFKRIATSGEAQTTRVRKLREQLKKETGVDPSKMGSYDPEGAYQAFGHGYKHTWRPDLDGPEWVKFQKEYSLYHRNTGNMDMPDVIDAVLNSGGKMTPTTDKLRRGIPISGMSPSADMGTGGASYFFTRIVSSRNKTRAGFYWKSRQVSRLDAISYDHDAFGQTKDGYVAQNRRTGVDQWKDAASNGSNETIFKNGLSLFDDLEKIVTSSATQRRSVIDAFKRHGYKTFPDGRALEDVIK